MEELNEAKPNQAMLTSTKRQISVLGKPRHRERREEEKERRELGRLEHEERRRIRRHKVIEKED